MNQIVRHHGGGDDVSPEDLVAEIAVRRISETIADSPDRKGLYSIVDLSPAMTSAVARAVKERVEGADVYVHPELDDGRLDPDMLSEESATHFRNMERPRGGGVILFSVPPSQLDKVGKTVAEIKQISEEALSQDPLAWLNACPDLSTLQDREKEQLASFVRGAFDAGIVTGGLPMLARFILVLNAKFRSHAIAKALDEALPALRIPPGAGRFKEFGQKGRIKSAEKWAEQLRDMHGRAEDILSLRNDRSQPLDRHAFKEKVAELHAADTFEDIDRTRLDALADDETISAGMWTDAQEAACRVRWEYFELIVKANKAKKKTKLGDATLDHILRQQPSALVGDDEAILESAFSESETADEEERDFFFRHRDLLKLDKKLLKRWEQFVFKKAEDHPDLLAGLLIAVADLIRSTETMPETPRIAVKLHDAEKLTYWKNKNVDLCRYLRDRFRGLPELTSDTVTFDFGLLWANRWDSDKGSERTASTARQFKFDVCLLHASDLPEDGSVPKTAVKEAAARTQLVWTLPANSFANAYFANMDEIANRTHDRALLGQGQFARALGTDRASDGTIDLSDRGSVQDAFLKDDGMLVNVNEPSLDLGKAFADGLASLDDDVLSKTVAEEIAVAFEGFHGSYTIAVRSLLDDEGSGLLENQLYEQAKLYGELLALLRQKAANDDCKRRLWKPALSIGIAHSLDKPAVAISCPWHPFRLAEARAKAEQTRDAISDMLAAALNGADLRTFARQVAERVEKTWHPTIAVVHEGTNARLLVETDSFADFALMEPPTVGEGAGESFDGYAREASDAFLAQAHEYLDLNPHERANFSVVLYNADNRELPSRMADQLARKIESERDLRCDLILTHTDQSRLRQIYADQNVAISRELDGVLASEAARTFLSRLRVGFLDVDAVGSATSARRADMVLLHEVIARGARIGWRKDRAPRFGFPSFADHVPEAQTRRLSHGRGERKSETLLVPSVRPIEVQRHVDLIHDLHDHGRAGEDAHFVPIREVNFDDEAVKDAIERAHNVAEWVVTFDFIANERLLKNNGINVIRNIAWPGSSHNVIVSTKKASATLKERVRRLLDDLTDKAGDAAAKFSEEIIREAASISGRVVMRAARQERNAQELFGLVLSKQVLEASLPEDVTPVAWLQLDDFGAPLGLRPGTRADLLVIGVGDDGDNAFLDLTVVESKFVSAAGAKAEARSALSQAKASFGDIADRVMFDHDLLNRRMWRARLADLLLEHAHFPRELDVHDREPADWAAAVRSDEARIRLRGLSFLFVHDAVASKPEAEDTEEGQGQYVFDRSAIAALLKRFEKQVASANSVVTLPKPLTTDPDHKTGVEERLEVEGEEAEEVREREASEPEIEDRAADVPAIADDQAPAVASPTASRSSDPAPYAGPGYPRTVRQYLAEAKPAADVEETSVWLEDTKSKLRRALKSYNLDAEIVGDRMTPNAAMIKFNGTDATTVASIDKLRGKLQTTHGVVLSDVRAGVGEVLVLVKRPQRAILPLTSVWGKRVFSDDAPVRNGSFVIGEREDDGEILYLNLWGKNGRQPQHGPHTLIAGESGGGKGVLTRNILLDMMATNSPRNLRLRFVDPKFGADYPFLEGMPHLDGGIVTDRDEAIRTLEELVDEMERRYREIVKVGPDIDKFNARVEEGARLPRIVLFHDEIGDWMADKESEYRDAVETYVTRLASKARAAGVHLFLITQRPDKDALPSQIKANMNNKICLKVTSAVNSRIVLDEGGAEQLLGQGHFAARLANEVPQGQSSLIIGQSPFIDDGEAWDLAEAIKRHW